jgi:hypothetical protein
MPTTSRANRGRQESRKKKVTQREPRRAVVRCDLYCALKCPRTGFEWWRRRRIMMMMMAGAELTLPGVVKATGCVKLSRGSSWNNGYTILSSKAYAPRVVKDLGPQHLDHSMLCLRGRCTMHTPHSLTQLDSPRLTSPGPHSNSSSSSTTSISAKRLVLRCSGDPC